MDEDIEKVIERAKNIHESEDCEYLHAHRLTSLPASKDAMKASIKERIQLLCGLYISLASYINDDDFKLLIEGKKRHKRRIYRQIANDLKDLTEEIRKIDLFN